MSLEEAKQHLRIDGDYNDFIISSLISQAREYCEGYQNRKYITQTLELVLDSFPLEDNIEFKSCSPIQSVTSVKYYGADGTEYTFAAENYIVDTDSFVHRLALKNNASWPSVELQSINAMRIRFIAGSSASAVQESVKVAMVLHIKLLFDDYRPDEREKLESARDASLSMNRVVP